MQWLKHIKPPKYLRYLFFIMYNWYSGFKTEKDNAHITTVLFLVMCHVAAIQGLIMFNFNYSGKLLVFLVILGVLLKFYIWFWHNNKWKAYVEEFNSTPSKKRKINLLFLPAYLLLCVLIGFYPIFLEVIFGIRL